jgi:hypothetical protein
MPQILSSRTSRGNFNRELRVQRGTRIMELPLVLGFPSFTSPVLRVPANFGIGPLDTSAAWRRTYLDHRGRRARRSLTNV